MGKTFRRNAQVIMKALEAMSEDETKAMQTKLEADGTVDVSGFQVTKDHISFKTETRAVTGRNFYPSVIEPSFGIGRLLYCLWEHSYYMREGSEERRVLALKPAIAPVKCAVLPLSKNERFNETLLVLTRELGEAGLINRVDDGGTSIGRRYARADEIGTPFGITVDFQTLEDASVTVRERDTMKQIRCSRADAVKAISDIVYGKKTWKEVSAEFPEFTTQEN